MLRYTKSFIALFVINLVLCYNPPQKSDPLNIPYEKFTLSNGLDVILHKDNSIPMVSVNMWYHVGSKNEKPGRTGFAHLFEHLMFEGSKHHDFNFAQPIEEIGGTDNGSTSTDRTNYWSNVPSNQLELALWLESDRMGFLLDVMTQEKLNNQRDIVKNEKRQNYDNTPYGMAWASIPEMMFPKGHPYSWIPIGSMEDLSAATLDDVSDFFRKFYIPNNASLCIAGDIDIEKTKTLVRKYFSSIPSGKQIDKMEAHPVKLDGITRKTIYDNVNLGKIIYGWHSPPLYKKGDAELDHLANILTASKVSRLYKTLVYEQQIAQDVEAFQWSREIGSTFHIVVTAKEGESLEKIEQALDLELNKIIKMGISHKELEQSKTQWEARFIRGLEQIGGFGGKADILNGYNVMLGDPGKFNWDLKRYMDVSIHDVRSATKNYLDMDNRIILKILPNEDLFSSEETIDRTIKPESSQKTPFSPPEISKTTLQNGLDILVIEDNDLPLVEVTVVLNSGWASDPKEKPGSASLTADLLDEGTKRRNAMEISEEARELGTNIGTSSYFDATFISFNSLKKNLDSSLDLFADILLNPLFPESELKRKKKEYQGRIKQESKQPVVSAVKHYFRLLFGEDHPYGQPYTGTGTEKSINAISRSDLIDFYKKNYFSNNATIIVVGDITLEEAENKINQYLGRWNSGNSVLSVVPSPPERTKREIYLIDKPNASQSVIIMGNHGIKRNDPDYLATYVMNTALGSQFTSRLNMNLREDKGYTYGTGSFFSSRKGVGPFGCYAPVQTKYTKSAIREMIKELSDIRKSRPLTNKEVENTKNNLINKFPRKFESLSSISDEASDLVMFNLSEFAWELYIEDVNKITGAMATQAAKDHIHPEKFLIVVVGDRTEIQSDIESLNLGDLYFLDENGNPVD